MCRMSSCLFSRLGKMLRTSLRMNPKSNERRVQRAFKHARHALIDRTLRSRSIDRPARRSRRWSTRPWSSLCHRSCRRRHRRCNGGCISTRPCSAQETRISGFFTVSLTSRKEELSHVDVPGASRRFTATFHILCFRV